MPFYFVDEDIEDSEDFEDFEDEEEVSERIWKSTRHIFKAKNEEAALEKRSKLVQRKQEEDENLRSLDSEAIIRPTTWSPLYGPFKTKGTAERAVPE